MNPETAPGPGGGTCPSGPACPNAQPDASTDAIWLSTWLRSTTAALRTAGCDAPRTDAELLAVAVLGGDRLRLRVGRDTLLAPQQLTALTALAARRNAGEPLAYILGTREFYSRPFVVTPSTLIPRPETEHLVETALTLCAGEHLRFADCGTGSGCVAVTLAAERPGWQGLATDISLAALQVAGVNAVTHRVADRLALVQADMARQLVHPASLDLMVSNPPYISRSEYRNLSREVLHEPVQALVPSTLCPDSPHGLECLAALIAQAAVALKPGGWLCLEHGWTQAASLSVCFFTHTWKNICVFKDLSGQERISAACKL